MKNRCLIDAGPLVALFDRDDPYHQQTVDLIKNFEGQLITTVEVITETLQLLDFNVQVKIDFLQWIKNGALTLVETTSSDIERIIELLDKYSNIPMEFTEASLVVAGERLGIWDIISIYQDHHIYRLLKEKIFNNIYHRKSE